MHMSTTPATSQTTTSPTASLEPPEKKELPAEDPRKYQAIVGSLLHISRNTRPDISVVTNPIVLYCIVFAARAEP